MSLSGRWQKAGRALAFARYIPARKILRRGELKLRRLLADRWPSPPVAGRCQRVSHPPLPLFAPRALPVQPPGEGWTFTFLHRPLAMTGPQVDWSAPGAGPQHQLLRMNLHYMEYLEGVDDAVFVRLVEDWLAVNAQPGRGAWRDSWNAYALSLRAVVWMQQQATRGERLPPDLCRRLDASLAGQLLYLERHLETDIGGNHLIKNIKALLWGAAYFTGPDAVRWRRIGLRLLAQELPVQVLPDGTHYERSPSYHCQVLADLLEIRHALGADPLGGALDDALRRMAQAAADLVHPDGTVALFNDAGLTMAYAPADCLEAYAAVLGPAPAARPVFALPDAGYFGLHGDGTCLVADCGRIAPDDLPAHGHGDVLSFEWSVGRHRIIVDPGVFEYVAGDRRTASRTAARHNTLALDGVDQADFFGAFRCGRRPGVQVRRWLPEPDGFVLEGTHDGYGHLPGAPRHVRRFEVKPDAVTLHDRIEGGTDRAVSLGFLLHPDVTCTKAGEALSLSAGPVRIRVSASVPLQVVPAVWWPDMGEERATHRIVGHLALPGAAVQTRFTVEAGM